MEGEDLEESGAHLANSAPPLPAEGASSSDIAFAEASLRTRYGTLVCGDKPNGKLVGSQLPDGR